MLSAEPISRFYSLKITVPVRFHLSMNGEFSEAKEVEHIWMITGPAGCGKTTVAQYLAKELSLPYVEGDDVGSIPTILMLIAS